MATVTEPPARGSLYRLDRAFDASGAAASMAVYSEALSSSPLAAGDVVGLDEDLVFVPPSPSAAVSDTHGVIGLPFTTFTYTVATDDDSRDASSSATPAVVRLYVGRVNDSPYLTVPTSLTARLHDYQVADVDAWETNEQLQVTLAANTLTEAARPSVLTLGGDVDRSELRFGAPSGYGDGTADQEMRFTAAVEASSRAVEVSREGCLPQMPRSCSSCGGCERARCRRRRTCRFYHSYSVSSLTSNLPSPRFQSIDIVTYPEYGSSATNVTFNVDDQGGSSFDDAGSLVANHTVSLSYRVGTVPHLHDLWPTSCDTSGGGKVTLNASNVQHWYHSPATTSLSCKFGALEAVRAVRAPGGMVACPLPAHEAGLVSLHLVTEVGYASNAVQFLYSPPLTVASVAPARLAAEGRAQVIVTGAGFVDAVELACLFQPTAGLAGAAADADANADVSGDGLGHHTIPAIFLSTTEISCTAPAMAAVSMVDGNGPAGWDLRVTNNGIHFTPPLHIRTFSRPRVTWLDPPYGPSVGGARSVVVHGAGFRNDTGSIICLVVDTTTDTTAYFAGTYLSPSAVACALAPPTGLAADADEDGEGTPVRVRVSLTNGADASIDDVYYRFTRPVTLDSLAPRSGPASGNTTIVVSGTSFLGTAGLLCAFRPATSTGADDDVATEGTWISSSRLSCRTPPASAMGLDLTDADTSGRVSLRVSANGHDVSEAHVIYFTYYLAPSVTGLTPQLGPASGGTAITVTGDHLGAGSVVSVQLCCVVLCHVVLCHVVLGTSSVTGESRY